MMHTVHRITDSGPKESLTRGCEICRTPSPRVIWKQRFVPFDDASSLEGYVLMSCDVCGFIYADGLPALSVFERYYRELSKYEPESDDKPIASYKKHNYDLIAFELAKRLPTRNARILDVGSASGELLSVLRDNGYTNLTGLDPSPRCAEVAKRRYHLRVLNTPISQMRTSAERFDIILLAGVLEHLRDLREHLFTLKALLNDGGAICIAVPNAARFADFVESPFQHLSAEHINFFTLASLTTLLATVGMRLQGSWETTHLVGLMQEPTINAIFGDAGDGQIKPQATQADYYMRRYITKSRTLQTKLTSRISAIAESRESVIVWGAGSLTMHLLTDPVFLRLNIIAFVDANPNYWGKSLRGVPLLPPSRLRHHRGIILVVSYAYEGEICSQIRNMYRIQNRVLGLFGIARETTPL